jgi:hypothetical protein
MKKIILAIAALGVVATAEAQYSGHNGHAHDSTTVSMSLLIDNALYLSPQAAQSFSPNYTLNDLMPGSDLYIGSVGFNVWSNREYDVNYSVTGLNNGNLTYTNIAGDPVDNDDNNRIPVGNIKMSMTNTANLGGSTPAITGTNNTPGYASQNYTDLQTHFTTLNGISANGGNIISEGRPAGGPAGNPNNTWAAFTLNWYLMNPQYVVVGGTYSCTVTISASQE